MAGIETGISMLTDILFNTSIFGQIWLIQLTIITATLAMITRKWSDWNTLALPVMVGWMYFGMPLSSTFLIIGVIMFVMDPVTMRVMAGSFEGITQMMTSTGRAEAQKSRNTYMNRRIEAREEVEKLKEFRTPEAEKQRNTKRLFEKLLKEDTKKKEEFELAISEDKNKIIQKRRMNDLIEVYNWANLPDYKVNPESAERIMGTPIKEKKKKKIFDESSGRMRWE